MDFRDNLRFHRKKLGMTQECVAKKMGITKGAYSTYETGKREPDVAKIKMLAEIFGVSSDELLGTTKAGKDMPFGYLRVPNAVKIPLVGSVACGEPILAEQNIEGYIDAPASQSPDFALLCKGDSMIDAGISDGDIVYIKATHRVENGQIAAVRIDDNATLKRVYWDGEILTLMPANAKYAPLVYQGKALESVHIEGLAIGYTHWF